MTEARQSVAGAYAKIEAHEELCAERYHNIRSDIGDLKDVVKTASKALIALAIALLAWGGSQIYGDLKHPDPPQAVATVVQAAPR